MFGKLRRATVSATASATVSAEVPIQPIRVAPGAQSAASPIPVSFYLRKPVYHTARKAAITRLHVEHATLARLNNAVPASHPASLAARPIARAAAVSSGRSTVVAPPAPRAAQGPMR
ncbi:MAG TPA: hypothetical protein VFY89_07170 [Ktedonobacterales bacterium]